MNLLADPELEFMRETAEQALDAEAQIQTKGSVSDGMGGVETTWETSGSIACRMAPFNSGAGERVSADRLNPDSTVVFTFPANTDIDHSAQILYAGGTFSVTAVRRRSQEITRRVEAKELE